MTTVGLLHPGAMGSTIGRACRAGVLWASNGRSDATRQRAAAAGLVDVGTVERVAGETEIMLSVCPPEVAEPVAAEVAACGFEGIYVDANAVAPATTRRIGDRFGRFVDGGIIGPPAREPGTTRLFLAGEEATSVAELFAGSALDARPIEGGVGAASALKMAYAAWTKGTSALLLAVCALADAEGVTAPLHDEWELSQPELIDRSRWIPAAAAPKAWRWVAEMDEIASTFESAGLPAGFHRAAGEIYAALSEFQDSSNLTIDQVIDALRS